jgi:hypothetical protein
MHFSLRLASGYRDNGGSGALARDSAADFHYGVESGEGFTLAPALRRIRNDCPERVG